MNFKENNKLNAQNKNEKNKNKRKASIQSYFNFNREDEYDVIRSTN